jgi:hypothetical protein
LFSHIFTGVSDFDRALKFYDALMACLALERRFCDASKPWAGWQSAGKTRPLFVICQPHNGAAHDTGNGQMVAFLACDRETVRQAHATALNDAAVPTSTRFTETHHDPDCPRHLCRQTVAAEL